MKMRFLLNYLQTSTIKRVLNSIVNTNIFTFSAFGADNEGGMQMPRSERILRAQDVLEVPCFLQNGKSSHQCWDTLLNF